MPNRVTGDREVAAALRRLGSGIPVQQVDMAAIQSMEPMRKHAEVRARSARNYVGKHPGFPQPKGGRKHVDQLIRVGKTGRQQRTRRKFLLGAVGRARAILHLLEFGTVSHFQPRFRGGFRHPGAKPHPIVSPAYHAEGGRVPDEFGRRLWAILLSNILRTRRR